ncbi:MAG TPA: hypothetical protein VGD99_07575 [Anaerolineae bacterium]
MLRQGMLAALIKRIGAVLFVVWIGGLAPLTYVNVFAASHFVPAYRIAIFESPRRLAANLPTSLEAQVLQQLKQRFMGQQSRVDIPHLPTVVTQFQSMLENSCLFGGTLLLAPLPQIGPTNLTTGLLVESAWLALPDPPPRPL